jgi:hypothetical protein
VRSEKEEGLGHWIFGERRRLAGSVTHLAGHSFISELIALIQLIVEENTFAFAVRSWRECVTSEKDRPGRIQLRN